jgi:hypothetical protein
MYLYLMVNERTVRPSVSVIPAATLNISDTDWLTSDFSTIAILVIFLTHKNINTNLQIYLQSILKENFRYLTLIIHHLLLTMKTPYFITCYRRLKKRYQQNYINKYEYFGMWRHAVCTGVSLDVAYVSSLHANFIWTTIILSKYNFTSQILMALLLLANT